MPDLLLEVAQRLDVAEVVDGREGGVGHAQLLALVDVRRAAVQVQHRGQGLRRAHPVGGGVVTETGDDAGLVVVVPVQAVPADLAQPGLPARQRRLQLRQPQRPDVELAGPVVQSDVFEGEHHVHLGPRRIGEQPRLLDGRPGHLPDRQQPFGMPGEHLPVHLGEELVDPRAADVVRGPVAPPAAGGHLAVGQGGVLRQEVDDVHPEAVHAALQPPAHHGVHRLPHVRVLPVEVGLLAGEQVEVVLAGRLVVLPGRPGEERAPVVRLGARRAGDGAGAGGTPPVPVASGAVRSAVA